MQNPYAHSAGPAPATPEDQRRQDYELALGKNADYYLPYFERFDSGGSRASWHWPAFFITSPWFLYRKMWGWGIGNLAWFWGFLTFVFPIALGIALGLKSTGGGNGPVVAVCLIFGILIAAPWFVLPIYANALYWKHINRVMTSMPPSVAANPEKRAARIERNGGTGAGAVIAVIAGGGLFVVAILGMLAAIAIPAYQDYTLRAQVSEGLTLAGETKAAVAEYFVHHDAQWPLDGQAAGIPPVSGKYVRSITVANGSVVITYGNTAHQKLADQRLFLVPAITTSDEIIWICGEHAAPDGIAAAGEGPSGSDIPAKYLPANCRP